MGILRRNLHLYTLKHTMRNGLRGPTAGLWSWPRGLNVSLGNWAIFNTGPFEDVFPITDLRNSYSYCEDENIESQKDHTWLKATHPRWYPRSRESVFRLVAHPRGISRHRDCFLGKEAPQILAQKTLAS